MTQPFSGLPDPGMRPVMKRRFQPSAVQDALRGALREARRHYETALRGAQRHGGELWRSGKRHPRTVAVVAGAIAVTLVGAYTLSASGVGRSLCPSAAGTPPRFLLLMDQVPHPAAGSELKIHYDVCGLRSGTTYRGRVRLSQQVSGKKKSAKPKPLVMTFQDKADGLATRRRQELELGRTRPGAYTLELSVTDNQGRERKRLQKIVVTAD